MTYVTDDGCSSLLKVFDAPRGRLIRGVGCFAMSIGALVCSRVSLLGVVTWLKRRIA